MVRLFCWNVAEACKIALSSEPDDFEMDSNTIATFGEEVSANAVQVQPDGLDMHFNTIASCGAEASAMDAQVEPWYE